MNLEHKALYSGRFHDAPHGPHHLLTHQMMVCYMIKGSTGCHSPINDISPHNIDLDFDLMSIVLFLDENPREVRSRHLQYCALWF